MNSPTHIVTTQIADAIRYLVAMGAPTSRFIASLCN
jgi:hypothetical protein